MTRLTVGSTFTGVGGIDLAFERTGHFETTWTSEVEPHASAVLAYQWLNTNTRSSHHPTAAT